ncbi:MAG TPA: dipeptidase [Acidimicrobiia bacterium]|nr:dipeptidase [Acidimicrobiia bacterium]
MTSPTRLHDESLVIDAHSDVHLDLIRSRAAGERRVFEERHVPGWRAGGVDGIVLSTIPKFGPDPYPYRTSPAENLLYMLDCVHQEISESPDQLQLVLEPDDFRKARADGKIGIMLGCEGAEPIADLSHLRSYHRLGLRALTLTWHQRNAVGDGVSEPSGSGLSHFGRAVVEESNRLGIVLDVSHAGAATLRDTLEMSSVPVIASHSNARALCDHERNLADDELRAIASSGGLIGVTLLGRFVAPETPTIHHVLDHIDHMVRVVGWEHVAFGTDYTTGGADLVIGSRRVAGPNQPVDHTTIPYAAGLETYAELPALTHGMLDRGHDHQAVRRLLGENFVSLFEAVVAGSAG